MTFTRDIALMKQLCSIPQIPLKHGNSYYPVKNYLPNLVLFYPGKMEKVGDYKLVFNGYSLCHTDIVRAIHDVTLKGHGNGKLITDFLVDLYRNGLNANSNINLCINVRGYNLSMDEFKYVVYWIVLQEDINFPRPTCKGIRLPITRYIEGAIAALHPDLLTLDEVLAWTGRRKPVPAFYHPFLAPFLAYNIGQII